MVKFFKDILTEDDNQTYCIARFAVLIGIITICLIGFYDVYKSIPVDFSQFGIGFGSVLGGGGICIGSKAATQRAK